MEFYRADEVFCSGTMGELVCVREIDGRPIGETGQTPMLTKIEKLFRALVQSDAEVI
jgi:branched-chain amino acid aminotransferase